MFYDVIIIGAGPAGLFSALELVNNSNLKILIVDKGKDIEHRKCPSITEFQRCWKCSPCNILCGLGGAGGLSDGKLNLKPDVGGNLEEFVSKEEADNLVSMIDNIFLQHGANQKSYGENSHELEAKAARNLVKKLGAEVVECAFIVELVDLKGRDKLKGENIYSVVEFEGE